MAILLAGQFSMVTRNAVDIWSQVRDRVRDELDNPNYDYLLEGTRPIEAAEDSLTVGVPSPLHAVDRRRYFHRGIP
jgi:hypothetical protein